MSITQLINMIYQGLLQFVPLFRVIWVVSVLLGIALLILAVVLKKNPIRKKSPWITGGFGLVLVISSGTQLIMSFI